MALTPGLRRCILHARSKLPCSNAYARKYATIRPVTLVGKPPGPPDSTNSTVGAPAALDSLVLSQLRSKSGPGLSSLIQEYDTNEGHVIQHTLPYESRPGNDRRVVFDQRESSAVVIVAHAIQHEDQHKVAVCSGFALNVPSSQGGEDRSVIVTCAHTVEEMRNSSLFSALSSQEDSPHDASSSRTLRSGSLVLSEAPNQFTPTFHTVTSVLSSIHRADLILLSIANSAAGQPVLPTLPVSPYPVHPGTAIRAHFVVDKEPDEAGWRPWVGGTWSKWVKGTVVGYRDFAGREAQPGTYDALSHLLFQPLPTPGSSGGPIVDEESGAVVGVMVGTRMDNRVEGMRGWGRPAETIFEMFSLPGLNLRKN